MSQMTSDRVTSEQKDKLFKTYQMLINTIEPKTITEATLKNIQVLNTFDGYTEGVSIALSNAGYTFESNLVCLHLGIPIDFHSEKTIEAIKERLSWLLKHTAIFMKLRLCPL